MQETLEEVMKKYKLPEKEHEEIKKTIIEMMTFDKFPVPNPTAIIDIAPPASGKTGLNGYGVNNFKDNNVVVINSDELKPFHPKVQEIARLYPEYYTKVTDQESNDWTKSLFDTVLAEGYNVIFEGTGKNTRILETIKSKMSNYRVIVRGMAVNELNCLLSIIDRYEEQVKHKGWGRLVMLDHFYETYENMPETMDAIEKSSLADEIEIYMRGDIPVEPKRIYRNNTPTNRFPSAKQAILGGRQEDRKTAIQAYEQNFSRINRLMMSRESSSSEEKEFLQFIKEKYEEFVKSATTDKTDKLVGEE